MKHEFVCFVRDSKITGLDRVSLNQAIALYEGREIVVEVRELTDKRTRKQLNFWQGIVVPLAKEGFNEIGYPMTLEDTHEILMLKFFPKSVMDPETGEMITTRRSMGNGGDVTEDEFFNKLPVIQSWCSEHLNGCYIPDYGEREFASNKEQQ